MVSWKSKDLDMLVHFLEQESQRCDGYKNMLEAVKRIGSLASAEAEARHGLEVAQIDLAWAQTELERVQTATNAAKDEARREVEDFRLKMEGEKELIRRQREQENSFLDAVIAEKQMALSKLALRLDEARKAASLLADALRG